MSYATTVNILAITYLDRGIGNAMHIAASLQGDS